MPTRETLIALRERVLKAEGPAHDLDVAIARWLYETGAGDHLVNYDPELFVIQHSGWTGSVDASLSLLDLLLPDARAEIRVGRSGCYCEILTGYLAKERHLGDGSGDCGEQLPLAILVAIFAALTSPEADHG